MLFLCLSFSNHWNIKISISTIDKAFYSEPKMLFAPHLEYPCHRRCRLHHNSSHCRQLAVTHSYFISAKLNAVFLSLFCCFCVFVCVFFSFPSRIFGVHSMRSYVLMVELHWVFKISAYDHPFDMLESYHLFIVPL